MFERVWAIVRRIPRGKVATYGAVAEAAGFPGASRQVVWALRQAKTPLPWHRVVGAGGKIRLPGEAGMEQRLRLAGEKVKFEGNRIDLTRYGAILAPSTSPEAGVERPRAKPKNRRQITW